MDKLSKKVSIIGGGPSGMMAAIMAAKNGHSVTIYEKNNQLGKKLAITGGGRCNLTYAADPEELIQNVVSNPTFLYSAFYTFGSEHLMDFFEQQGVPLKIEQQRVFPQSDRASDIIKALEKALVQYKVRVLLNNQITDIHRILDKYDAVIVATGGCSYPNTGSTGDGYCWAKELGLSVIDLRPALVSLYAKPICDNVADLAGLSLSSIGLTVACAGKTVFAGTGELLFTHKGISGPLVLKAGGYLPNNISDTTVTIDLKPDISPDKMDAMLLEILKKHPNMSLENILNMLFPKRLCSLLLGSLFSKKANAFTKKERGTLVNTIKNLVFNVTGTAGFKESMITAGGINVCEINPSDMSSKKIPKLYFVGEVLDVDAHTGGFNLQIAFSTGYLAGNSI